MAHDDKTEKPTAKRKKEARKKGQVAKSTDLNAALVLVGGLIAVSFMGPAVVSGVAASMRSAFGQIARPDSITSAAGLNGLFHSALHTLLTTAAPIAGICAALGLLANVAQVGFKPSATALKPDFKRLNPATGFKNIFGAPDRRRARQGDRQDRRRRRGRRDDADPRPDQPRRQHRHPARRPRPPDRVGRDGHRHARGRGVPADRDRRLRLAEAPAHPSS